MPRRSKSLRATNARLKTQRSRSSPKKRVRRFRAALDGVSDSDLWLLHTLAIEALTGSRHAAPDDAALEGAMALRNVYHSHGQKKHLLGTKAAGGFGWSCELQTFFDFDADAMAAEPFLLATLVYEKVRHAVDKHQVRWDFVNKKYVAPQHSRVEGQLNALVSKARGMPAEVQCALEARAARQRMVNATEAGSSVDVAIDTKNSTMRASWDRVFAYLGPEPSA